MIECVVNISEGRHQPTIDAIADAAGADLLDRHTDAFHNRTVLTLVGEQAPRAVATEAVDRLDLATHVGVHPRIGVVDVVPFVALDDATSADAVDARDAFCAWAGDELAVPCFRYGTERTLPDVRRHRFAELVPDCGPTTPHLTAGAIAVGARDVLVAYNVWLHHASLEQARATAGWLRRPGVRTLGLQVGDQVQISMDLTAPDQVGPDVVVDAIASRHQIDRCELVGLTPRSVLNDVGPDRWGDLDLSDDSTIEKRLEQRLRQ